jgi:hypothetical protein
MQFGGELCGDDASFSGLSYDAKSPNVTLGRYGTGGPPRFSEGT